MSNLCRTCGKPLEETSVNGETYLVCHGCKKRFRATATDVPSASTSKRSAGNQPSESPSGTPKPKKKRRAESQEGSSLLFPAVVLLVLAAACGGAFVMFSGGTRENPGVPATPPQGANTPIAPVVESAPIANRQETMPPMNLVAAATADPEKLFDFSSIAVPRFPELGTPETLEGGIRLYKVRLTGGNVPGEQMVFHVYLPDGDAAEGSLPVVLMPPLGGLIAGAALPENDHKDALLYVRAGMAVVAYSLDGATGMTSSGTALIQAIYQYMASQAGLVNSRNALEFALARVPEVNPKQIFCAGFDTAGTQALLFAAHEPRLAGCVVYAPTTSVIDGITLTSGPILDQLKPVIPNFESFCKRGSPITHATQMKCPIYIYHSSGGVNVPLSYSQKFKEKSGNDRIVIDSSSTVGHYFTTIEGIPAGINWIKQQVDASETVSTQK